MVDIIKNIFLFSCKLVLIEWAVELIRMSIHAIINNVWPQNPYEMDKWNAIEWFMNCLETIIVAVMLYLEYSVLTIIMVTYMAILVIKQSIFFIRLFFKD